VTGIPDHLEWGESLGAYALGALPEDEAERLRHHLETCPRCRAELASLRTAVDALPASVAAIEPPPELKQRVMQIVEAEAALLRAAGEAADHASPPPSRKRWRWRSAWRLPVAATIAAAAVAGVVIGLLSTGTATHVVPVEIVAQGLKNHARATLTVRGEQAQLHLSGLPALPLGHVEEIWVKRGTEPPVPAGIFLLESGSVPVTRPVHPGDLVLVTIEPGHGRARPTTVPILVARI
jgi:anti-sigma-K factor RskA